VMVNCYGCQYQSKNYVQKNSIVTLEIPRSNLAQAPRIVRGRVIWVQRPRTYRNLFLIGVEFDVAGNVWCIQSPPKDWFPHPEDEELVIPVYPQAGEPMAPAHSPPSTLAEKMETAPQSHETSKRVVKETVEAAVAIEMERVREQIDMHIHDAIEGAVKVMVERVTNAALDNLTRPAETSNAKAGEDAAIAGPPKRRRKAPKPKV
jgi:hypothetical protein